MKIKTIFCIIGQLGNGGTEKQLFLFLKHLDREKYNPYVIVSGAKGGIWRERIENESKVPVIFLGNLPSLIKLFKFNLLLIKHNPDIIFSWSFFTNAFNITAGKKIKFIGSLRQQLEASRETLSNFHYKKCVSPKRMIVNSSLIADELVEAGYQKDNISIISNIYEHYNLISSNYSNIRKKYNIPEGVKIVVGVGRDSPTKDFPFFIDVVDEARKKDENIHGLIIGSGGTALKGEIETRDLDKTITFVGEIPDARELLPVADIFFLSSKFEGMPNVLLEAIDAGCAPVATDVGGVRDILSNSCGPSGFIIKNGDIEDAVEKIIKLSRDDNLRKKIVRNAKNELDKFSPDNIMEQFYRVIEA